MDKPIASPSPMLERLETMLASGEDSTAMRFGLANGYLNAGNPVRAAEHLRAALELDRTYSAAWKLLGKALLAAGEPDAAGEAWQQGIAAATDRGDVQAAKEMLVFLRRLDKANTSG